jgi:hypothetical protein
MKQTKRLIPCCTALIICKDDLIKLLSKKIEAKISLQGSAQVIQVRSLQMHDDRILTLTVGNPKPHHRLAFFLDGDS